MTTSAPSTGEQTARVAAPAPACDTASHPAPRVRRRGLPGRVGHRWARVLESGEAGMSTAEYAVGTVAACAFAAVLFKVVTGGSIVTALRHLITKALATLS